MFARIIAPLLAVAAVMVSPAVGQENISIPVAEYTLVKTERYERVRRFAGRVEAQQNTNVAFDVSGRIDQVLVDEGDRVAKGDVLARLDARRLQAARDEAHAGVTEARAALALAQSTYQRTEQAAAVDAVSELEFDNARESLNMAQAMLARQQAMLARLDVDLENAEVIAPYDAWVVDRFVDAGLVIAPGTPVLRLQQDTSLRARLSVGSDFADTLQVGQVVPVVYGDLALTATVKAIVNATGIRARSVNVILDLPGDFAARPGDLVDVSLSVENSVPGYWVPRAALTETVRGLWAVYVIDPENTVRRYVVDVIDQSADQVYVRGDLDDQTRIVAAGTHRLVPGQVVQPVDLVPNDGGR